VPALILFFLLPRSWLFFLYALILIVLIWPVITSSEEEGRGCEEEEAS
jgi:hypothetical protein